MFLDSQVIRIYGLIKTDMIPGVNIIGGKKSVASVNGAGRSGSVLKPSGGFRGRSTLRKFLGSTEHLD